MSLQSQSWGENLGRKPWSDRGTHQVVIPAPKQVCKWDQTTGSAGSRAGAQVRDLPEWGCQHLFKDSPFLSCSFLTLHLPAQGSGFRWKNFNQSPEQQR